MTSKQYRAALTALRWTHKDTGLILGFTGRTSQRYADGDARIPRTVAAVLRAIVDAELSGKSWNKLHQLLVDA